MGARAEAILSRVPDSVRERLDSMWFWVIVANMGAAFAIVLGFFLLQQQGAETAKRVATQRASAQASVTNCASNVRNAPVVAGFVEAHRSIITNSILTTTAALQVSPKNDPLHRVRIESLSRLERALRNADHLAELVAASTPTKADCNHLADGLAVPLPFPKAKGHT